MEAIRHFHQLRQKDGLEACVSVSELLPLHIGLISWCVCVGWGSSEVTLQTVRGGKHGQIGSVSIVVAPFYEADLV